MTSVRGTIGAVALVVSGLSSLQASAGLLLSPDGTTVYDTVNNVSWLADANTPSSNRFGLPVCTDSTSPKACVNQDGSMSYQAAAAWVAAMNAANYLGHTNWQLPTTPSADASCPFIGPHGESFGFGCVASALGSLYYNALGLAAPNTAVPIPNNTAGPFINFQPYLYWSQSNVNGTGYGTFSFNTGFHGSNTVPNYLYVLPMIQGKLPGTPPAAGSGLQVNPGGQTIYDPVMNVTWLANANLAATNTFGLPPCKNQGTPKLCVNQDGAMNWNSADQFVKNMNTYNGTGYLGQTNWVLPPMDPGCGTSYSCASTSDPLGQLFYDRLGLSPGKPVVATPDIAVGPFTNLQPYLYWACGADNIRDLCNATPAPGFEWSFSFGNGFQGTDVLGNDLFVTAYFVGSPTPISGPVNYQGLWWNAAESGWGVNLAHQGDLIFATWFTYDTSGNPLWLSMLAAASAPGGNSYAGPIYVDTGPAFNKFAGSGQAVQVGNGTLIFSDVNNGSISYTVSAGGASNVQQTKAITRFDLGSGPLPTCIYSASPDLNAAVNYQDLWWAANGTEPGWGINLVHQRELLFATWYTYGADDAPLWLSALLTQSTYNVYTGPLVRTFGPHFDNYRTTDEAPAQITGTATVTFVDGNHATFGYATNGNGGLPAASQSVAISRFLFTAPAGTVCQ